jgi:uncharacterized repeat protein (TIGR01451 family)
LTDTLPVSVTNVVSASNATAATYQGGQIVWEFGDIAAGITETVYITLTAPVSATNGFVLTNSAVVTTTSVDNPSNNAASVGTTLYQLVPIATVRAGSSGTIFAVQGKIIVAPGTYNGTEWALQDSSGGIAVYHYPPPVVSLGDTVKLIGERGAYNGQEQFSDILYFENLASGAEVAPLITDTGAIDTGSTEGWLVRVEGVVSGLNCPNDHSFDVDDGSGSTYVYVDSDTGADLCSLGTENGDNVQITGFSTEYNGTMEIKPRRPADLMLLKSTPDFSKDAPSNVAAGSLFTYTITLENFTGSAINSIVVTDVIPASNGWLPRRSLPFQPGRTPH